MTTHVRDHGFTIFKLGRKIYDQGKFSSRETAETVAKWWIEQRLKAEANA